MSKNFFYFLRKTDKQTIRLGWFMLCETTEYYKWLLLVSYSDIVLYLKRKNIFVPTYRQIWRTSKNRVFHQEPIK
jgi:hypothetical protein